MARKKKKQKPVVETAVEQKTETNSSGGNLNVSFDASNMFEKWGLQITLGLTALIGFIVFKDYLLFSKLYLFKDIGSDTVNTKFPLFVHAATQLQNEGIPTWSFSQGMGQNIFPVNFKNPLNFILYLLNPETLGYRIAWVEYLKIIFAGTFFFYYLKTLKIGSYTRIIGALSYAFTGFMIVGGGWYGYSATALFAAFMLLAFEKLFVEKVWWYFPIAIFFMADTNLYFYGLFLFIYSTARFFSQEGAKIKEYVVLMLKMAAFGALGIAISLPFFVSIVNRTLDSPRVGGTVSLADKLEKVPLWGLENAHHYITVIMRFFSNDLLGGGELKGANVFKGWKNYLEAPIFYCGLPALVLMPQLFINATKRERLVYGLFLTLWMVMVIFPFFRHAYNMFSGDYYKTSLSFIMPFSFIFLSVLALHRVLKHNNLNKPVLIGWTLLLLVLVNYGYSFTAPNNQLIEVSDFLNSSILNKVNLILVLTGGLLFLFSLPKYSQLAKIGLLLVLCYDLGYTASGTVNNRDVITRKEDGQKVGYKDYSQVAIDDIKSKDTGFYRINKDHGSGPAIHGSMNDAIIQGFKGTPSYRSLNQGYYIKFLQAMEIIGTGDENATRWAPGLVRPLLRNWGSVKYHITNKAEENNYINNTHKLVGTYNNVRAYENKYFIPFGFTYDSYILRSDFDSLKAIQKDITLLKCVVVENDELDKFSMLTKHGYTVQPNQFSFDSLSAAIAGRKSGALDITEHSNKLVKGKVSTPKDQLLFFSIPWDSGWSATVDGQPVDLQKCNVGFMGLPVTAGDHEIELNYGMPNIGITMTISVLSLLLFLGMIAMDRKGKLEFLK